MYCLFIIDKTTSRQGEMVSRVGFVPRDVIWRHLIYCNNPANFQNAYMNFKELVLHQASFTHAWVIRRVVKQGLADW